MTSSKMVREISIKEIDKFIAFGNNLYKGDSNFVPFIDSDLKKTIKKLVFEKKRYKALCSFDANGQINGRVLLTVKPSKQLKTEHAGYFSHFEVVDDQTVFDALMTEAVSILRKMGGEYIVGSFFPHDPDNRRGILVKGFELFPMIFTSHNPPYYQKLFEQGGFGKLTDALEYEYKANDSVLAKIKQTAEKALVENDIHVDKADLAHLDHEIADIQKIMEIASTQINFEDVISADEIAKIIKPWKMFINPDYAFIARRNSDNMPIGFTFAIPNYNEIIKKANGKMGLKMLLLFVFGKKRIKGIRGMLQYIIPEYQHKGVSKALYWATKQSVDKNHVERVSLGTIMEANASSNGAITSLGGELSRVYRIYYKKIV